MQEKICYKKYPELFGLLVDTQTQAVSQYTRIKQYFSGLTGNIDELVGAIQKFSYEYLPKSDKRAISPKFTPPKHDTSVQSELGKAFPDLASSKLMQEEAFNTICDTIKTDIVTKLDKDCKDYQMKFNELVVLYQQNLNSLQGEVKKYETLHADYVKAGKAVQDAIKSNSKNVNSLKSNFKKAKAAALDGHQKFTMFCGNLSVQMEKILSNFEDLEQWRCNNMQILLRTVSDSLFRISTAFVEGKSYFFNDIHHAPIENDTDEVKLNAQLPETSDNFQLIKVNPAICHFLTPEQLFAQEIAKKHPIYKAKRNFAGMNEFLRVIEGEYVVGLSEAGGSIKCQNVNESIGFLPKDVLERVK
ncbi:hypothetical protein TRFO_06921 [Tritrichomonas foetus]|uniref:SH3 domain-containing protein n=1 Tax=Tritrichomonas foetus TaxID=1144522 RepID=A0A1J4JVY4_9EUKA|nr:hypothetical protein TRFO_06921 [Tritrichomonas foetus]|eukprot:OHT02874.1 hypothetical protein TRFO_06921 [Tritrichomonas foetus]